MVETAVFRRRLSLSAMLLVTGANGFVGRAVVERMTEEGRRVRAAVRHPMKHPGRAIESLEVVDLSPAADWSRALRGVDSVVHAAARVHVMHETVPDPLEEFRRVNVAGTLNLARQAAAAGVRRFVFISSVKVHGEETEPGRPYRPDDPPAPRDAYAVSKLEAEQGLQALGASTGMTIVVIRPVLVYGPGVKGNFRTMMRWLYRGWPLPLGALRNARSLVALENLLDFISTCLRHPKAAGRTFLVSDDSDLSTTQLLRVTAEALGTPARLFPVPVWALRGATALLGGHNLFRPLLGSLQVDITDSKSTLGWSPPVTMPVALRETAADFIANP